MLLWLLTFKRMLTFLYKEMETIQKLRKNTEEKMSPTNDEDKCEDLVEDESTQPREMHRITE